MNTAGEVSAIMVECKGPPFLYRGNTGSGALAAIFGLFSFPVCVFPPFYFAGWLWPQRGARSKDGCCARAPAINGTPQADWP